eukprot:m.37854 g.37854  ORF g.37854 m.37854 type:complete len:780 (+) comp12549_c0_seq5:160-2499(+)
MKYFRGECSKEETAAEAERQREHEAAEAERQRKHDAAEAERQRQSKKKAAQQELELHEHTQARTFLVVQSRLVSEDLVTRLGPFLNKPAFCRYVCDLASSAISWTAESLHLAFQDWLGQPKVEMGDAEDGCRPSPALSIRPKKSPSDQAVSLQTTPACTSLSGSAPPSSHWAGMEFLNILDNSLAQLDKGGAGLKRLDLSWWHPDVRPLIKEDQLLPALRDMIEDFKRFVDYGSKYHELYWSLFLSQMWNAFVSSALEPSVKSRMDSEDQELGASALASESKSSEPQSSFRFFRSMLLKHQMPLGEGTSTSSSDMGASVGRVAGEIAAQDPIRLIEVQKKEELNSLMAKRTRYQVQCELQHVRATNAASEREYPDIRQAFVMETMSKNACLWELMIPCQSEDSLAKEYPAGDGSATPLATTATTATTTSQESGRLVPIKLVALDAWPGGNMLMSMWLAMLHLQLRLTLRYLEHKPSMSRGFQRPTPLVEDLRYFPNLEAKNLLRYEVDRQGVDRLSPQQQATVASIDGVVGAENWSGFCVKTYDYYYRSAPWTLSTKLGLQVVQKSERRRAPDSALRAKLEKWYGLADVARGGDSCAVLITPWFVGYHVPRSWEQALCLLEQLQAVHHLGYVHGDILQQNLVFATLSDLAWIIDWDMARLECESPKYVSGFNHHNFDERHCWAKAEEPMMQKHDCYSLAFLLQSWFRGDADFDQLIEDMKAESPMTEDLLLRAKRMTAVELSSTLTRNVMGQATNSPDRGNTAGQYRRQDMPLLEANEP